jgi:formate hydrogenlyase subunit 3/multisubunit Na+/H+ antiporter MnhD subunit
MSLLASTLINVALFFRIFDKGLYVHAQENAPDDKGSPDDRYAGEAPLSMLMPAFVLTLVILLMGIFNQVIVNKVIRFAIPMGL